MDSVWLFTECLPHKRMLFGLPWLYVHINISHFHIPHSAFTYRCGCGFSLMGNICHFRGKLWAFVIAMIFMAGLVFFGFAWYHQEIESRDFTSITSASIESKNDDQDMHPAIKVLKDRLLSIRTHLRSKWKQMNRKKIFFKRYNARYMNKKHLQLNGLQRRLNLFLQSHETPVPRGLYIFERLDNSILYTYGMFVTVSLPKVPTVWSIRMFTGWWWLYCILVSVAYKASMTANLANPPPT